MKITVGEGKCWICGESKGMTVHHALPQHLCPKNNVLIPICGECHRKLNTQDVIGMYNYLSRMNKELKGVEKGLNIIMSYLTKMGLKNEKEKTNKD